VPSAASPDAIVTTATAATLVLADIVPPSHLPGGQPNHRIRRISPDLVPDRFDADPPDSCASRRFDR